MVWGSSGPRLDTEIKMAEWFIRAYDEKINELNNSEKCRLENYFSRETNELKKAYKNQLAKLETEIQTYDSWHQRAYKYTLSACQIKGHTCCINELQDLKNKRDHCNAKISQLEADEW